MNMTSRKERRAEKPPPWGSYSIVTGEAFSYPPLELPHRTGTANEDQDLFPVARTQNT